jgi:hypothetical protein
LEQVAEVDAVHFSELCPVSDLADILGVDFEKSHDLICCEARSGIIRYKLGQENDLVAARFESAPLTASQEGAYVPGAKLAGQSGRFQEFLENESGLRRHRRSSNSSSRSL